MNEGDIMRFKKIKLVVITIIISSLLSITAFSNDVSSLKNKSGKDSFSTGCRVELPVKLLDKKDQFNSYLTLITLKYDNTIDWVVCFYTIEDEIPETIMLPEKTLSTGNIPETNLKLYKINDNVLMKTYGESEYITFNAVIYVSE